MSNLQMMDSAVNDKRSVAAMLRGKGDKRENVWLSFKGKHEALMSQDELHEAFNKAVRFGRVGNRQEVISKVKKSLLVALGILVIVS